VRDAALRRHREVGVSEMISVAMLRAAGNERDPLHRKLRPHIAPVVAVGCSRMRRAGARTDVRGPGGATTFSRWRVVQHRYRSSHWPSITDFTREATSRSRYISGIDSNILKRQRLARSASNDAASSRTRAETRFPEASRDRAIRRHLRRGSAASGTYTAPSSGNDAPVTRFHHLAPRRTPASRPTPPALPGAIGER